MSDRGYINLIRHLTRTSTSLPLETAQASIAHYLARPPEPIPGSPTALAATVLGSAYFRPYTFTRLTALTLSFRHAVHLRVAVHRSEAERDPGSILPPSRGVNVVGRTAKWCKVVLEGFSGSAAVVRLACASGLLLGLEDWEKELQVKDKERRVRVKVEEELVLALAEVVDAYAGEGSGWETDFKKSFGSNSVEEDVLSLSVLLASQAAPFVAPERLQALPLHTVIDVLVTTIQRSFYNGTFLTGGAMAMNTQDGGKLSISAKSTYAQSIRSIAGSSYIASMSSLARFTARAITVLIESRRAAGWEAVGRTLSSLQALTASVESDWARCPLAAINADSEILEESQELATATWQILKTLLFTTLMVLQSVLSAVVFVPSHEDSSTSTTTSNSTPLPYAIALDALHTLSHLSFVMPQFGGVASTAEGGLPELKRAFYMALDVLSASEVGASRFVDEMCGNSGMGGKGKGLGNVPRVLADAKKAFALACIEQLVPVLTEPVIQSQVYPLCHPHLWDSSHRETYESAHSVMLAIFASHALHSGKRPFEAPHTAFAEKVVPMYAQCLVENSFDGGLSTTQLCMAYAALVRSASSFGYTSDQENVQGDSMAWFCIEVLLDAIRHARAAPAKATLPYSPEGQGSSSSPPLHASATDAYHAPSEHLHRLYLTLIATVPSLSLALLPRLLAEVKAITISVSPPLPTSESEIRDHRAEEMRAELVEALFKAISQDVGDAEKGFAIEWWYEHREDLVKARAPTRHPVFDGVETSAKTGSPDVISRL